MADSLIKFIGDSNYNCPVAALADKLSAEHEVGVYGYHFSAGSHLTRQPEWSKGPTHGSGLVTKSILIYWLLVKTH